MQDEMLVENFLCGIKESIWMVRDKYNNELIIKLINKKNIFRKSFKRNWNGSIVTDYWFFNSKETKLKFLELNIHNKIKEGELDHSSIGKTLGFPPKAVEMFTAGDYLQDHRIGVDYHGMYFMSYKQTIIEDLLWLFDKTSKNYNNDILIKLSFMDDYETIVIRVNESNKDDLLIKVKQKILHN